MVKGHGLKEPTSTQSSTKNLKITTELVLHHDRNVEAYNDTETISHCSNIQDGISYNRLEL